MRLLTLCRALIVCGAAVVAASCAGGDVDTDLVRSGDDFVIVANGS